MTTRVRLVATNRPNSSDTASAAKMGSSRMKSAPAAMAATAVSAMGVARTTADCALMLNVLARPDFRDWHALPHAGTDWTVALSAGVRGMRVAYSPRLGYVRNVDPDVEARVAEAVCTVEALGAQVEEVDPGFADCSELYWTHWTVGAYNGLRHLPPDKLAMLERGLQGTYRAGEITSLSSYLDAVAARAALGTHMRAFHEKFDLLLTPTLAVPAFDAGRLAPAEYGSEARWIDWTPFSFPFNLTQQPAMSVPCGFTREGLPVGLQIVGPLHREDLVLRAGSAFELATGFGSRRPELPE